MDQIFIDGTNHDLHSNNLELINFSSFFNLSKVPIKPIRLQKDMIDRSSSISKI